MLAWWMLLPTLLAMMVALVLPGFMWLRAGVRSSLVAIGAAPAFTFGLITVLTLLYPTLDIPWEASTVMPVLGMSAVGGAGFADGFAVVQGFLQGEQFGVFVNHVGDFVQNGRAFGSRGFTPCFERFLRSGYSSIDIGIGCVCELGQLIAIGRVIRG